MTAKVVRYTDPQAAELAASHLISGEAIIVYFNGAFAFLADMDSAAAGQKIFEAKQRPAEKTLALVCDPEHLGEFVDLTRLRFPWPAVMALQREIHALGVVLPAREESLPASSLVNGTVLNVWTDYPPHRPFVRLQAEIRSMGLRAFQGASANLSGEPTYTSVQQLLQRFSDHVPLIIHDELKAPAERRTSTSILDLTAEQPTLVRLGNVGLAELNRHLADVGLPNAVPATDLEGVTSG